MSHNVLVLNCGSSSLKYAIINADSGDEIVSGQAESLATPQAILTFKHQGGKQTHDVPNASHGDVMDRIMQLVSEYKNSIGDIHSVGHRVVHGGETFKETALLNDEIIQAVIDCSHLAPLHNPPQIEGIKSAMQTFDSIPHVAVFDTAFHQSIAKKAFLYAIPYELYTDHNIRKYGMHGSSYRYITGHMQDVLQTQTPNLIIAHLGNGGSVAAIAEGKSVDTTMGLTPLEGIVHGTRSGDIDPALPEFIANRLNITLEEVSTILWKKSGLLGLSQISHDCRTLEEQAGKGNSQAQIALDVYCYRLAKHISGLMIALPKRADALVFTGGIGENSTYIRATTVHYLAFLGIAIDEAKNQNCTGGTEGIITTDQSTIPCHVVPTNEELVIARDAMRIAKSQ